MPQWKNTTRRDRLPADWPKRRKRVGRRDGWKCQMPDEDGLSMAANGSRVRVCGELATDIDHKDRGDNHDEGNLWSLCDRHHKRKTGQEGAAAYNAKRREIKGRFKRTEDHPGLL